MHRLHELLGQRRSQVMPEIASTLIMCAAGLSITGAGHEGVFGWRDACAEVCGA